jgi:hypothetical protein
MTNNITSESLAAIAADAFYAELTDAAAIDDYTTDCSADALDDALDTDIADMLHNANQSDLFPSLDDDALDAATDRLLHDNDFFDAMIAELARIIRAR